MQTETDDCGRNKEIVRRLLEQFWGAGDLSVGEELYADDVLDHAPLPGQAPGKQGMLDACRLFCAAFDIDLTVEELVAERDLVVDRWSALLTHRGEFLGVAPSGRTATVHALDMMRIADGKIVEAWHQEDMPAALRELGIALP